MNPPSAVTPPSPPTADTPNIRTVAWATMIGTAIEWYDFFTYGIAAALVFNTLFFPAGTSPVVGTLLAFSTYAVGFAARPVGGVVFAHYGDKIGRKSMLVVSLLLMGGSTFCIGLLPGFPTLGVAAPLLLVALRIVQGFGVGGEWGAAALMAVEHAPPNRRGFYGSWPQMGVPAGMLIANLAFFALSGATSDHDFQAWGWRVPFLASAVLVVLGLVIRLRVSESPVFRAMEQAGRIERRPVIAVLRTQPANVLRAAGIRFAENSTFYIHTTFVLTYGTTVLTLERDDLLIGVIITAALGLISLPLWGRLSDRVGRRPVVLFGSALLAALSWPFFWALDSGSLPVIYLVTILCINVGNHAVYAPQSAYFAELFEPEVRYSGASIGSQAASVLAGGLSPLIATALLEAGDGYHLIALYMTAMALITVCTALISPDPYRQSLKRSSTPGDRDARPTESTTEMSHG
ncbi:MFS transporter [Streptomyces iranensis]|uniref:Putative proline/betaine transporter n=1 Tax=Streptomyces iranensis TaxID=576784 RepID=A0A061A081_9ACTN|nr:MFS transporter [Streptomyces iranensis]MBP2059883.1 metabolite-proton symporter [Streptomyces iranensis]CDR14617.1 General substrate transporter [Streptomyces iranensis]